MKKKILMFVTFFAIMVCLVAITASAASFTVNYNDGKATQTTDENGEITLRDTGFTAETDTKFFFGWFSYQGDMFKPGQKITLEEDIKLYEFYGFKATQQSFQTTQGQWNYTYIQLQEDINLATSIPMDDGGRIYIDLNGYTLTSSANNVFEQRRAGVIILGEGSLIHTGSGSVFNSSIHGYGDGNVCMYVGKDVTLKTPGTVYNWGNSISSDHINAPVPFGVYGDVTCAKLMNVSGTTAEELDIILDATRLTVTGDSLITFTTYPTTPLINLTVGNGTFELSEAANSTSYWDGDNAAAFASITFENGATFTNGAEVVAEYMGASTVQTTVNGTTYSTVLSSAECEHDYILEKTISATCMRIAQNIFVCSKCNDEYTVEYGELADHAWTTISDIPATTTTSGLKTLQCDACSKILKQSYSFDPTDLTINVVVNTENGEKTVSVKVSDVFNLTSVDNLGAIEYTLVGVKDFGEYLASDIISIEVPIGINYINFDTNSTIKTLILLDYADVTITSFAKTAITKIYIGSSKVAFKGGCSNNVIQAIYSDVSGADVYYDRAVFSGKKTITELTYSAGSKYEFGENAFKEVEVKEIIFPDYCTVTFSGNATFYNCAVEYLYIGLGNETLAGKPFDYCQKMQKIILMDVNKITGDYTFCVENGGEKPVEVYIHSETMSLTGNTFFQCHGIIVYTNAPLTTGFNSCTAKTYGGVEYPAYTIYYGIPHKFTAGTTDATCTKDGSTGYVTDCPCGKIDESKEYKIFTAQLTNSETFETGKIETVVIPAKGHSNQSTLVDMIYANYFANAQGTYLCPDCSGNYYEEVLESALFTKKGYSATEEDTSGITYAVVVNHSAINMYKPFANGDIRYGVVVSATTVTAPILGLENEEIKLSEKSVAVDFSGTPFIVLQMKITGLAEAQQLVASGFIMEGDRAMYLGQGISSATYEVISHAIVLEVVKKETILEE